MRIEWIPIKKITRGDKNGIIQRVYSLDVAKHGTYVADGYVTHNSIYGWAGSSSKHFQAWGETKRRVMPRSYRCGREILEFGEHILRECSDYWDRGVEPADHESTVEAEQLTPALFESIDPRESWLFLARTNHLARKLVSYLDAFGLPWSPTRGRGGINAPVRLAAVSAFATLEKGAPIDGGQWQDCLKHIEAKPYLEHGMKSRLAGYSREEAEETWPWMHLDDLGELGALPALMDAIRARKWRQWIPDAENIAEAFERWGEESVINSKLRVGTIHSVKGAEADNVLLLTTLSLPCFLNAQTAEGYDEEQRVFYVGATRAKKRLIVAHEDRPRFVKRLPI